MTNRRNFLLGAGALATPALAFPARAATPPGLIIENVTLLPMTGAAPIPSATVTVTGGRIAAIHTGRIARPRTHMRIDGSGKYLMPGLTDAHAHLEARDVLGFFLAALKIDIKPEPVRTQDAVLPYLANGVLQLINMAATPDGFAQKRDIASGKVLGPRIVSAAMIDGAGPSWPVGMTRVARNAEEGRASVRQAKADGYQMIKPYSALDLDTFTAIIDEARKLNLPVAGHIPARGKGITEKFFQPGFGMVAHAEEFAQRSNPPDIAAIPRYVEMAKASGAGLIATLTLDERLLEEVRDPASLKARPELAWLHPTARRVALEHNPYVARRSPGFIAHLEKIIVFNRLLVKAFADAGIPILAGTDSGVPGMAPGFALHDELAALVAAGLTSSQALTAATAAPGAWLKSATGMVEVGQHADLLLLDADPLADIANTRKISAIVMGGRHVARAELDRRMAALAQ
ncbi:MAG TPA: amidohydrolase family protein [Rhizomicrobium sp.]|nr:amidohydrolase family protein [Rhizomicrobium sp.]